MAVLEKDIKLEIYKRKIIKVDNEIIYGFLDEFSIGHSRLDMVGVNHDIKKIYVLEIKSKTANNDAIQQLADYVYLMETVISASKSMNDYEVCGILISPSVCAGSIIKYLMPKFRFLKYKEDGELVKEEFNLRMDFLLDIKSKVMRTEDHLNFIGRDLPFAEE